MGTGFPFKVMSVLELEMAVVYTMNGPRVAECLTL